MNKKRVIKEDDDVIEYERNFQQQTTYLNDFKRPILGPEPDEELYRIASSTADEKQIQFKDTEETKIKVPIDFFFKRKSPPVEETVESFLSFKQETDEVRRTRPRVYKLPEVSLDDIPDKDMRDMIIKFVYTSETHHAMEEAVNKSDEATTSTTKPIKKSLLVSANDKLIEGLKMRDLIPIKLNPPRGEIKSLSGEETVSPKVWDDRNKKCLGFPTEKFWKNKHVHGPDYDPTTMEMPIELKEHVDQLIKNDGIRFPHFVGFNVGFKPNHTHKIPLEKKKFGPTDFWFTCNQFYGNFYTSKNE